jgi:hypothetical protein
MRVIVHFVDIGRIVHLHCLNFLFHSVGILSLAVFLNEFREHNFLYKVFRYMVYFNLQGAILVGIVWFFQ